MFSQAADQSSTTFQQTIYGLRNFIQQTTGGSGTELMAKAKGLIIQNISAQAFVQGIDDDFLVGSLMTLIILVPLVFLKYHKKKNGQKIEITE
jgi:DHA2 family multidrug resistance protein